MGIVPGETLFLDDGPENIEAARKLGFHAALVPPGEEFAQVISRVLCR
jgi:putative hydrolase of the HAD superfamily